MPDYAVIALGGKQYRVREGERLLVDRLAVEEGQSFEPRSLAVGGPEGLSDGGTVSATVEEHRYAEITALLDVDRQAQEPSLVIAIVGACSDADITALNRWRTNQATGLALLIDSATWTLGTEAGTGRAEPQLG